jgi:hypothetical protein
MRSQFGQVQERASVPLSPDAGSSAVAALASKEIPYDYVATFPLTGQRGNRVQGVINISVEGAFVAVAIGYSFIPLSTLNVEAETEVITGLELFLAPLVKSLLVRFIGIDFKYSIVDSGTGRELQNKPIHNIAGLGEPTGDRPFRPLAKPMLFMPRSTIRIEVEEISEAPTVIGAELYIVLHGYKILGYGTALP